MGQLSHLILLAVSFLSCESFASQREALEAAMRAPEVASHVPHIRRVDVLNSYHCPDCYDIQVLGNNDQKESSVTVRTESDGLGSMNVHVLQISN